MSNKKTKKSGLVPAAFASDPMAQIEALIKKARKLKKNQGKKFDKGGSNTSEDTKKADEIAKNLKKILLDIRLPEKDRKKAQSMIKRFDKGGSNMGENTKTVSNQDRKRVDELLSKFKKIDEPGPVDIKNLKKILSRSGKTISDQDRKKAESVIKKFDKGGSNMAKTIKAKNKNPELEKKSLVGIAGKQYTPVKPKKELSIAAKQYTPKIKKMNKGGVFKGIF